MALRFEEFAALRKRTKMETKPVDADKPAAAPAKPEGENTHSRGYFFETYDFQVITLILIALDVGIQLFTMIISCGGSGTANMLINGLESFAGFLLFFFVFELLATFMSFRVKFFSHLGNLADICIVLTCLIAEVMGKSRVVRLFGIVRVRQHFCNNRVSLHLTNTTHGNAV